MVDDEGQTENRSSPISRKRIESLSDLIFGLTLSIGALTLISQPPAIPDELSSRIIAFIFDFTVLIAVWIQYTTIMSRLPVETGRVVFANVLLLLLIILMSYLINGIHFTHPPLPIPENTPLDAYYSQLYGLVLAVVTTILGFFSHQLSVEEKHLLPRGYLSKARLARNSDVLFTVVFLVSALPQAWDWWIGGVPLRLALWWIPLIGTLYVDALFFLKPKTK